MRVSYTEDDDNYLIKTYGIIPVKEIAESLGRTVGSISGRASKLGLKVGDKQQKAPKGMKICTECGGVFSITEFLYENKGKKSQSCKCYNCRTDAKYQARIDKKIEEFKKKNGYLSNNELVEREEKKNSQTFTCTICKKEKKGTNFKFKDKKSNEVDSRCKQCRTELSRKNKLKNIVDGRCW